MQGYMNLETLWFLLIAVLWLGYFFLEGFDFGVGILLRGVGKNDTERRVMLNTIGPVWDANEVWLLVAGGATFAAFPLWYATLFSGFYLALFVILIALIFRNVAIEFRSKRDDPRWRNMWDWLIVVGSALPALLWGVAWGDILAGVPIVDMEYVGNFFDLLRPYSLFFGVTTLVLFASHGALYLTLKTTGDLRERAHAAARALAWPALALVVGTLIWTFFNANAAGNTGIVPGPVPIAAIVCCAATVWLVNVKLDGWAFVATAAGIVLLFATVFLNLYPRVLVSSVSSAQDMTIFQTSSSTYTLTVMTIVAVIFVPLILIYTAWTYWVFRARVGGNDQGPQSIDDVLDTGAAAKAKAAQDTGSAEPVTGGDGDRPAHTSAGAGPANPDT